MTPFAGAFVLLVFASLADVLTTRAALTEEPAVLRELNPFMRPFVGAMTPALVVKGIGVFAMGYAAFDLAKTSPRLAALLLLLAAAGTSWLAWRNARLLRAVQGRDVRFPSGSRLVVWPGDAGYDESAAEDAELRAEARAIDEQVRLDAFLERLAETDALEARILAGCA